MFNPIRFYFNLILPDKRHDDPKEAMTEKGIVLFTLFGLIAGTYSGVKWLNQDVAIIATAAFSFVFGSAFAAFCVNQRLFRPFIVANMTLAFMTFYLFILIYELGAIHSPHIYWPVCIIIASYLLVDRKSGLFWSVITFSFVLLLVIGERSNYAFPVHQLDDNQTAINQYSGYLLPIVFLWLLQAYGTRVRDNLLDNTEKALRKAEKLSAESSKMSAELSVILTQASTSSAALLKDSVKLSSTVGHITVESQSICSDVEQQASGCVQITQTLSHLANSVENSTKFMSNIRDRTHNEEERILQATKAMNQAIHNMDQISQSNKGILTAMSVITDISEQTNLLALNAAIEAARAGEQGRGFAVVADEVRNLSIKSNDSAKGIKVLLDKASTDVKEGVSAVNQAGDLLTRVVESVKDVNQQINQVTEIILQQNTDIEEIVVSSTQIAEVSQKSSDSSRSLSSGVVSLSDMAKGLSDIAQDMHQLVKRH